MAEVAYTAGVLTVRPSGFERLAGLLGDLEVPRAAIGSVRAEPNPLARPRGLRAPGLGLPYLAKIGTWRWHGVKDYVIARRGQPGLLVELDPRLTKGVARLVVSTRDADAVLAALGR